MEFFPRELRIGSSLREFRIIEGSRNRVKIKLQCYSEANPRETTYWLELSGGSRNRG